MAERKHKDISTSQLLNIIRNASSFSEVTESNQHFINEPSLGDYLFELLEHHGLSAKEVIFACGVERSYFYHILSGKKIPSRNMVLRIALCLDASASETAQLLRLAGQGALYPKVRRDAAILYAIHQKYTMRETNDLLLSLDEQPLYREDYHG